MATRTGRRIAIVTLFAVIIIVGTLVWLSRDHIRFLLAFESLGRNVQGYAEYRHRQTGIVFVSLPGGTFMMGSPEDEEGRQENEGPVHEVTLSPFMISKYEVTQAQWVAVMGTNPSEFEGGNIPVETVSWEDCQEFCARSGVMVQRVRTPEPTANLARIARPEGTARRTRKRRTATTRARIPLLNNE